MRKILLMLIVFGATSITSAPKWVPDNKTDSYDRMVKDLERFADILDDQAEIIACIAREDYFIIQTQRGTLKNSFIFNFRIEGCHVESGVLEIIFSESQKWTHRLKKNADLVTVSFIVGLLSGIFLSLL